MKGIIDRFVGDYAVVEFTGRRMVEIPKKDLPAGLKEGDTICCNGGVYVYDEQETENEGRDKDDI